MSRPDEFAEWKTIGEAMGFKHVESSPLTRRLIMHVNKPKAVVRINYRFKGTNMTQDEKQAAIDILNKILELELAGVVRYTHYAQMVFGYNRIPIVSWLKGNGDESLDPCA